ncbi:MAG: alpha/beta hydrolase [Pseudomonadota bacterium]
MKWLLRIVLTLAAVLVVLFLIFRTPDTDAAEMRAKYGGEPSQFVEIGDGVTVHLRDEGPRDGVPIILLHGSNADLHTWEPWVEGLKDTYRVIRFDQVGHGLTGGDPNEDYSRSNFTADILEVADALALDRFILGGNSMGGKHALSFAVANPDRLGGLILVDGSGGPIIEDEKDEDDDGGNIGFAIARTPGINRIAEQITPRSLIEQSLRQSVTVQSVVTEEAVDRYWELLRYPGNRRATMARFSTAYDPMSEAEISAVTVPTLIIWGEEDRLIPVAAGQWLDEKLPNSQLAVYPAIGHLPHEEAAGPTLADLKKWLLNLEFTKQEAEGAE